MRLPCHFPLSGYTRKTIRVCRMRTFERLFRINPICARSQGDEAAHDEKTTANGTAKLRHGSLYIIALPTMVTLLKRGALTTDFLNRWLD